MIYIILKKKFEKSKLKNLIYRNFKNFKTEQFKSNICNGIYNVKAHSTFENNFYFNTLTANYEYSRSNTDKLPLPVQMQVSKKPETFSTFFIGVLKSALNFEHFEKKKKKSLIAQVFLKVLTPKDVFT